MEVKKYPAGEDKVARIAEQIHIGAMVFMRREYKTLFWFALILFIILILCLSAVPAAATTFSLETVESRDNVGEYLWLVLDDQGRSATVTADTDVQVLFIPRDQLLEALARSPKLAISLMKEVSLRMREFNIHYTREVVQAERLALVGRR